MPVFIEFIYAFKDIYRVVILHKIEKCLEFYPIYKGILFKKYLFFYGKDRAL